MSGGVEAGIKSENRIVAQPAAPSMRLSGFCGDEFVHFKGVDVLLEAPPRLYIDDYTILREVEDVTKMLEGDHCIVGVNFLHKLSHAVDAVVSTLTSWHIVPFYHHFVLLDSVASLSADGEPLNALGEPVRVIEFSDTVAGAWHKISSDGRAPLTLLRNAVSYFQAPAKLHTPPLRDYLPLGGRGVFIVDEQLTVEQRRRTAATARALVEEARRGNQPIYRVFSSNCEHLAWMLDQTSRRWVSPQVSHGLWKLFRLGLQGLSLVFLYIVHTTPHAQTYTHAACTTAFHLLSTVPVSAQTQVILVRTCVNLTSRRARGHIAPRDYDYLMAVEVCRACSVMALSVACLTFMPHLVWGTGYFRLACALSLAAHSLAQYAYSVVQLALCRVLLALGWGVPFARFDDVRDTPRDATRYATHHHDEDDDAGPPSTPPPRAQVPPPPRKQSVRQRKAAVGPAAGAGGAGQRPRSRRSPPRRIAMD